MSIYDKFKDRKRRNTRHLIGAKNITDYSLETYAQGEIVFFYCQAEQSCGAVLGKH